MIRVPLSPTGC